MNISTLAKRAALAAVLVCGSLMSQAQTFLYEGVVYKVGSGKLTAQKPSATAVLTNGEAFPTDYTGDIVVPAKITYEGKDYPVTSIAAAFKETSITSIDIADGIPTIGRGGFQGCTQLKSVKLPSDITAINGDLFSGCTALEEVTFPGGVKTLDSNQLKDCTSLKKITFASGTTELALSRGIFGSEVPESLEEVVLDRPLAAKYNAVANLAFRGVKNITKFTVGANVKELFSGFFTNCTGLKEVTLPDAVVLGTDVFAGSGIEELTFPAALTAVPASTFQNCKSLKKVVLGSGVTTIGDMAFMGSTVSDVNLPETLESIGQMAFSGANLSGALTFPAKVAKVGVQAFANNAGLTAVALPAATKTIGDGAFMGCTGIATFAVDAANEAFKTTANGDALISGDGVALIQHAPASATAELKGDYTTILPYAAYKAANLTSVSLPNAVNWGDYALSGTGITKLALSGLVGRYVASECPALTDLTLSGDEVPFGVAANCGELANVTLSTPVTIVKQDAFLNCAKVKDLNLGTLLSIIETDAFKGCGVETLSVGAPNPAAMAQGVFNEGDNITVNVPVDYVDAYKNAGGWKYLNIVGDANVVAGPSDMGMPAGLYYANPDGKLYCAYADGQTDEYEVGGVPHTFQLIEFKNRIYGASAGQKFVYSATGSVDGDGKLFYISQVGGKIFQAVVLDNKGNNAYKDPFGLYIYGDTLFVNDRNVCIRKIGADAIALPQNYPSWVENNWLGFYGSPWIYGCIKAGWGITSYEKEDGTKAPQYWVGMKYNGNGIYTFTDEHVGTAAKPGAKPENGAFLSDMNPIFTTFHVDEAHNHMYIYVEKAGTKEESITKGGLYRIDMDKLKTVQDPKNLADLDAVLIDGSPVKFEGAGANEHVGISQLNPDAKGEYLYWCYRAPSEAEATANEEQDYATMTGGKYWWADKFDVNNPLHKTGIKRIKLGEENPTVEMVVPGAEGYGVVAVNYEGSTKPAGVKDVVAPAAKAALALVGDQLVATKAAVVYVYNAAGTVVAYGNLAAGQALSVADLAPGVYVATANGAPLKFVK